MEITKKPAVDSQQSTVNSRQSTVNSRQSTVISRFMIFGKRFRSNDLLRRSFFFFWCCTIREPYRIIDLSTELRPVHFLIQWKFSKTIQHKIVRKFKN